MKKIMAVVLALCMGFALAACGAGKSQEDEAVPAVTADGQTKRNQEKEAEDMNMKIGDTPVTVAWEDNASVEALKALCAQGSLTIDLHMYGGFEQVGDIGESLPRNDAQTTTQAGDIVLYSGDQMVVFYGSNSWAYTRLGRITDQDETGMRSLLGNGDVTVTLTVE